MDQQVEISRIIRDGNSHYLAIPTNILAALGLRQRDRVALRISEQKLVVERVPLERLALLRQPETHPDAQ